jgi:dipeptidyl-peptidase 4
MRPVLIIAGLIALWSAPLMAQDAKPLTLERIFASPSINGPTPRAVKLSPDGSLLTSLRPRDDDRERLIA